MSEAADKALAGSRVETSDGVTVMHMGDGQGDNILFSSAGHYGTMSALKSRDEFANLVGNFPDKISLITHWDGSTRPRSTRDNIAMTAWLTASALLISRADVYLWKNEIWQTAASGAEAAFIGQGVSVEETDLPLRPEHWTIDRDLLLPEQFLDYYGIPHEFVVHSFTFYTVSDLELVLQETVRSHRKNGAEHGAAFKIIHDLLWTRLGLHGARPQDALACVALTCGMENVKNEQDVRDRADLSTLMPRLLPVAVVRAGASIDAYKISGQVEMVAMYTAARRFLNLPCTIATPHQFSRPDRRRYERDSKAVPVLRQVLLRKPERKAKDGEEEAHVEFGCHFMVKSHWRKPNDRMIVKKPIFVSPYVKGNPDLPFRVPTKTIYNVSRE